MVKKWICEFCSASFTAKHSKVRHMTTVCCQKQTPTNANLKRKSREWGKERTLNGWDPQERNQKSIVETETKEFERDWDSDGLSETSQPSLDADSGRSSLGSVGNVGDLVQLLIAQNERLEANIEAKLDEKITAKYKELVPYQSQGQNPSGDQGHTTPQEANEGKIDIICLAKGDYLKKIIELHDGDEEKAMNYIKNVGIATDFLEGDFRMIKKIYFDGKKKSQFPIRIKDYKRNKLEYLEENGEWILDIRGEIVGKRLCENIVSTLLIANTQFNEIIINEEDEDRKELLLDLFQINKTQAHIMKLLERKTQGKLSRRVTEFINYCTEVHAETGSLDNVKKAYE